MVNFQQIGELRFGARNPIISVWWSTFAAWHCIAVMLLIRRFTGAFVQPLPGFLFVFVSLLVVLVSALLRIGALRIRFPLHVVAVRGLLVAPAVAALFILGSVTIPNSPLFAAIAAWIVAVATETVWLTNLFRSWQGLESVSRPPERREPAPFIAASNLIRPAAHREQVTTERVSDQDDESLPADVTQQLTRSRHEGGESIAGLLRVDFAARDRTQIVHLAFCPPFKSIPTVDVAQVSGPTISTKVTQVEQFGVRIEVKHQVPAAESCSVVLEIEATADEDVP